MVVDAAAAAVEDASYVEARFLRTLLTMSSTEAAWTTDPPYSRPQEERQTPAGQTVRRGGGRRCSCGDCR